MQRVARHGEHDGEDEGIDGADEGDGVEDEAEPAVRVDAVEEDDERELGQGGRPEVGHAHEKKHLLVVVDR